MATFYSHGVGGNYPERLIIQTIATLNSQSVVNNSSNVTIKVYGYYSDSAPQQYNTINPGNGFQYIRIDATGAVYKYSGYLNTDYINTSSAVKQYLMEWTGDIPHNSDGTKTTNINVYQATPGVTTTDYLYGSHNWTLPTIARSTQPSLNYTTRTIGDSVIVDFSSRASSTFTHTVKFSLGSYNATLASGIAATSYTWALPSALAAYVPSGSSSATGTFSVETYSGTTLIGTKTVNMTTVLRKSNFTRTPASLDFGSSVSVAIVRDATNLTHEVKITLGSRSAVAASAATTSASYTIPTSWGDQVASGATSGTATITVTTKNGSAVVGSDTTTITLNLIPNTLSINSDSRTIGDVLGITIGQQSTNLTTTIQYIGYTTAPVLYPTPIATTTASTSLNWTLPNAIASTSYFPSNVASFASMKIRATTYNGNTQIGSYTEKTLTVYLKASSASISPTSLNFGSNITTTINRIDSRLTHDVKYTVGTSTKTITGVTTTSNTSTIDAAWIEANQNLKTATGSVQTITKNGNATVGSVSSSFTATVPVSSFTLTGHSPVVLGKDSATTGTINYTISRAHTTLTHTITYVFGNQSGTIATKTTATTGSWKPPLTLANAIPNGVSGGGTITVETFNGTVSVGQTSMGFTVNLHANIIPTLSATASVVNTTTNYVQGKSKSSVTITAASGGAGTTGITSYSYTLDNKTYTVNGINAPKTSDTLMNAGAKNIVVTVKDSRDRTASLTIPITVYAYTTPTLTKVDVYRSDASGVKNDSGNNLAFKISGNIAAVNNSNTRHLLVQYKESAASTYTTIPITTDPGAYVFTDFSGYSTTISGEKSYDVKITLTDGYSASDIEYAIVPSTFAFLEFQGGANGTGVAVGKTAELANTLDVGLLGKFREDVTFDKAVNYEGVVNHKSGSATRQTNMGSLYIGTEASTGVIIINIGKANNMIKASISIRSYNYNAKIEVGGYTYISTASWHSMQAYGSSFGGDLNVRLSAAGINGDRYIMIGETTTAWGGYLHVTVDEVSVGYGSPYSAPWNVSLGTVYSGTTNGTFLIKSSSALATAYNHSQATHAPTNAQANQTLTSGNGMAAWTATSGDLTISLGTPGSLSGSTTNATTATSHTHAVSLTAANVGALPAGGTAVDSAKLNGVASAEAATGSTIVKRHASGYIFATYFNQSSAAESTAASHYMYQAGTDGYLRKKTLANVQTEIVTSAAVEAAIAGTILAITASGGNQDNGYVKYSNGYQKVWKTYTATYTTAMTVTGTYGYRSDWIPIGGWYNAFTAVPSVQYTLTTDTSWIWLGPVKIPTATTAGDFMFYKFANSSSYIQLRVEAYGPA